MDGTPATDVSPLVPGSDDATVPPTPPSAEDGAFDFDHHINHISHHVGRHARSSVSSLRNMAHFVSGGTLGEAAEDPGEPAGTEAAPAVSPEVAHEAAPAAAPDISLEMPKVICAPEAESESGEPDIGLAAAETPPPATPDFSPPPPVSAPSGRLQESNFSPPPPAKAPSGLSGTDCLGASADTAAEAGVAARAEDASLLKVAEQTAKKRQSAVFKPIMTNKVKAGLIRAKARAQRKLRYQHMQQDSHAIPLSIKHIYAAPTLATNPIVTLLAVYLNSFYELIGAELSFISFYIALARSLDVLSDPIMSFITDSTRSSYGRRRPFMFTGAPFYAGFLYALLAPPGTMTGTGVSNWFGLFYILFFLSNTYATIPYDALGPEMTDNYEDRSKLFFVQGLYETVGALVAITMPMFAGFYLYPYDSSPYNECYDPSGLGEPCYSDAVAGTPDSYNLTVGLPGNFSQYKNKFLDWEGLCNNETVDDGELVTGYANYCLCIEECDTADDVESQRDAYRFVALFFGVWFLATIWLAVAKIRERCQLPDHLALDRPSPLVPSLLNTFRNRPFTSLLPAWILDSAGFSMLASMVTYYVRYHIKPEFTTSDDQAGLECTESDVQMEHWECRSIYVLGGAVTLMLLSAICSCPFWLLLAQRVGKVNAWLAWSCSMAVTNFLLILPGEGDVYTLLFVAMINGFPVGAKFLADAILADVIDYDEFLTGSRNEATYTMFRSFLPKICAIPCLAVPVAVLDALGHVAPKDGVIQEQPAIIGPYCVLVGCILPTLLSVASFFIKSKFPLRTKEHIDMVTDGIALHMGGHAATEPISGVEFSPLLLEGVLEHRMSDLLDAFPGTTTLVELLDFDHKGGAGQRLVTRTTTNFRQGAVATLVLFVVNFFTFQLLEKKVLSLVPVFLIIGFGMSCTYTGFCYLRNAHAIELMTLGVEDDDVRVKTLLFKCLRHRRTIAKIFKAVIFERKSWLWQYFRCGPRSSAEKRHSTKMACTVQLKELKELVDTEPESAQPEDGKFGMLKSNDLAGEEAL